MRHQPGDAAIAVEEWMYPQKPMMGCSDCKDRIGFSDIAVTSAKRFRKRGTAPGLMAM